MIRRSFIYIVWLLLSMTACNSPAQKELEKWEISLNQDDKRPYGAYLAYRSLKYYFPGAGMEPLSQGFRYSSINHDMTYGSNGHTLMILYGLDFYLSKTEWGHLKEFIHAGNEVIIFCSRLDARIQQEMNCYKLRNGEEYRPFYPFATKESNRNVLSIAGNPSKLYGYDGHSINGYFSFDTAARENTNIEDGENKTALNDRLLQPDTLGYAGNHPDFVRYIYGNGHLTLHAAPLALSNYFLLQPGNEDYMTAIWQTLPQPITSIYWHSYYKRNAEAAGISLLWRYTATRLAICIAILAVVTYVLFEGKRKQRMIPVIALVKNDSVSFVETVGRLYYNKGDHTNLSEKMIQQFMEWVRTRYSLNTNLINEHFIQQLAMRSGQPEASVRALADMVHEIKLGTAKPDDAYLYQLYTMIQQFYKKT